MPHPMIVPRPAPRSLTSLLRFGELSPTERDELSPRSQLRTLPRASPRSPRRSLARRDDARESAEILARAEARDRRRRSFSARAMSILRGPMPPIAAVFVAVVLALPFPAGHATRQRRVLADEGRPASKRSSVRGFVRVAQ